MDTKKWNIQITAGGSRQIRFSGLEGADWVPLYITVTDNKGKEMDLSGARIAAWAQNPEIAQLDENQNILPVYADPEHGSIVLSI